MKTDNNKLRIEDEKILTNTPESKIKDVNNTQESKVKRC